MSMSARRWIWRSMIAVASAVPMGASAVTLALLDDTIVMEPAAPDSQFVLVVRAVSLTPAERSDANLLSDIRDTNFPAAPQVHILDVRELQAAGEDARLWVVMASATGMKADLVQTRYLSVAMGGSEKTLSYTLSNVAAGSLALTVTAPSPFKTKPGKPVPLWVSAKGRTATQVHLARHSLNEKTTGWPADPELRLCATATERCNGAEPLRIERHQTRQLWLWAPTRVGRYEGSVAVAAAEGGEGAATELTVTVSTGWHSTLGVLCILAGVLAAWLFFHLAKERAEQLQWSLAAAELLARATRAAARARGLTLLSLPKLTASLEAVVSALDDEALHAAGLPGIDWAPGLVPRAGQTEVFKAYLKRQVDAVDAAELGIDLVERSAIPDLQRADETKRAQIVAALAEFDALYGHGTPSVTAVGEAFARAMQAAVTAATLKQESGVEMPATPPPRDRVAQVRRQIAWLGVGAWSFTALLTTATGAYLLIFSDPYNGFGVGLDYLKCFLWGVGIPSATQLFRTDRATANAWTSGAAKG